MQNLTVNEAGIGYLWRCLRLYCGGTFFLPLYALCCLFFLFKGSREEKEAFGWPALMLLLTVFNPLFPLAVNRFFDINKEYYRFLWIAPVAAVCAYALSRIILAKGDTAGKRFILLASAVLFISSAGVSAYADGYTPAPNIYKMPEEVLEVSRIIRRDSGREYPKAACDYEMNMELRQYDASILLTADRDQYIASLNNDLIDEQTAERNRFVNAVLAAVAKSIRIPREDFFEAMEETDTEYVVIPSDSDMYWYFKGLGLRIAGETGSRTIFHYELKEEPGNPIGDYTDVWAYDESLISRLLRPIEGNGGR